MIVYKATFPNNKAYIGCTIRSLNERKRYHKYYALKCDSNTIFTKAIRKYSWDNIIWEILYETIDHSDLLKKEIELISSHNTLNPNGYNLTMGGEGTLGHQSWPKGKKRTEENKYKMRQIGLSLAKSTIVVDTIKKTIKEYSSVAEASRELNIQYSIMKICRKHNRDHFQYRIFAKEDFILTDNIFKLKSVHNSKKIKLTNGLCIIEFESMIDAVRKLNLTERKIRNMVYLNKTYNNWGLYF